MKNLLLILTIFATSCVSSTRPIPGVNYHNFKEKRLTRRFEAVGVLENVASGTKCTGTFIEKDVVLTAAHCVEFDIFMLLANILTGKTPDVRFYAGGRVFHAEQIIYGSASSYETDVAFIIISEKDNIIRPIPLATPEEMKSFKGEIDFVGYGFSRLMLPEPNKGHGITLLDGGKKRVTHLHDEYTLLFGHSSKLHILPGDSGGPVIDAKTGKVFAVASSYFHANAKYISSYYGLAVYFGDLLKKHRIDRI